MADIGRIRELIAAGLNDVEVAAQLQQEDADDQNFGWDNPRRTLHSLALTMRRAAKENRVVAAKETLLQLELFRVLWEEMAASGECAAAETTVLAALSPFTSAPSVSQAYIQLHADMVLLSTPAGELAKESLAHREAAAQRYRRHIGVHAIICSARVAAATAEVTDLLFQGLARQPRYRDLFTEDVLRPCLPLLLVHRGRWPELLAAETPACAA